MTRDGLTRRESLALTAGAHAYKIRKVDDLIAQGLIVQFDQADSGKRVTFTRLVTGGLLAFGARKRTGHFYLNFYSGEVLVKSVRISPRHERDARAWVTQFNRASIAARDAA